MKGYLARDLKGGSLFLYPEPPTKVEGEDIYLPTKSGEFLSLPSWMFKKLTYQDGPIPVDIIVKPRKGKYKRKYGVMK
jgi:hypothetical protein